MVVHESNAVVKYTTWPSSGTTVANEGSGGASYAGTEYVNHYTTTPSGATAQQFLLASNYVRYPYGAEVNNLSAFTLELLWLASSGTGDVNFFSKYLSGGVSVTYIAASSRLYIKRGTTTGSGHETWYCTFSPSNGSWYDIQVSWGAIGSTPIIKINNDSKSLTHDSTGTGAWNDDSGYKGVFIYNGTANAGTLTILRMHDTNLSDAYLTDNYTEDWKRTSTTITISGANISAEASITGGAVKKIVTGPLIEARTYLVGGTLKKVVAGPSISAEGDIVGGSFTITRQIVVGPTINAEASVAGGAFSTNILGSTIDAEASVLGWGINRYITGPEINAEASIEIAENNLITTLIGALVEVEADIAGGSFAFYATSSEATRIAPFLNEFVNPYEENAVSSEYQYEAAVEDNCVVKYAIWPTTGTTIANGMGDSDYDGTAADNDYTVLFSDATCFNFDAVSDSIFIPHGTSINNINQFTEEYLFYTNSDPLPSYTDLFMKGWAYYFGFYADGRIEFYRENIDGWILCYTIAGVIIPSRSFYVQLTWDATDYTNEPILKVNGTLVSWDFVDNTVTSEDWYDDSGNDLYIFGDSDGAYGNIGPVVLYRRHNAVLTDGELLTNYLTDDWRAGQNPRAACIQYEEEKPFIICPVDDSTNLLESEVVADEVNDLTSDEYVGVEAVSLEDVILDVYELGEVPGAWETYNLRPLAIIETIELALVEEYELD